MGSGQHIVVGVDGSEASLDALRCALRQAQLTKGAVEAVISWQYPHQYGVEFYGEELDWEKVAMSTLEAAIREVADALAESPDVTVTQRVRQGHPAEVLVDSSAQADMLVVGSHGHGGFRGMLVGSVTKHATAHAKCPVLVVRRPRGRDPHDPARRQH